MKHYKHHLSMLLIEYQDLMDFVEDLKLDLERKEDQIRNTIQRFVLILETEENIK